MLLPMLLVMLVPTLGSDIGVPEEKQEQSSSSEGSPESPGYPLGLHYSHEEPYFDLNESTNVTALLGKTAVLNCRVKNIGNRTVSWVRHRDTHLLSVGRFTYTSDQRFSARHSGGSSDWLLMIHYLQRRDSGTYECQVSSTPPIRHRIHLSVVEPETVIEGGPDIHIDKGSRLALTCSVRYGPEPPAFIFWYHDDKLVSYDRTATATTTTTTTTTKGGVGVRFSSPEEGLVATSRLLVHSAHPRHSGVYTCTPSNSEPRSVNVHVIADQPAAVLHDNNSASEHRVLGQLVILIVIVIVQTHSRVL